jgi:Tfp pilus assembly protein PilN
MSAIRLRTWALTELVGAGLRWWVAQLRDLIPVGSSDRNRRAGSVLWVDVLDDELVVRRPTGTGTSELVRVARQEVAAFAGGRAPSAALAGSEHAAKAVVVRFPPDQVQRKRIELPLVAESRLRAMLPYELERHVAADLDSLYVHHRVTARDRSRRKMTVELALFKRAATDAALGAVRRIGLSPSNIAATTDDESASGYPAPDSDSRRSRVRSSAAALLAGIAMLLGLANLGARAWQEYEEDAYLASELTRADAEAAAARRLRQEIARSRQRLAFLPHERASASLGRVLNEVSRLMDDDTWVFEFEMRGGSVHLRGLSAAASSLVPTFDASPMFENARFGAPLTQGTGAGVERFDLLLDLKGSDAS